MICEVAEVFICVALSLLNCLTTICVEPYLTQVEVSLFPRASSEVEEK